MEIGCDSRLGFNWAVSSGSGMNARLDQDIFDGWRDVRFWDMAWVKGSLDGGFYDPDQSNRSGFISGFCPCGVRRIIAGIMCDILTWVGEGIIIRLMPLVSVFFLMMGVVQERLEYDIKYGPILLGSMVLERLEDEWMAGELCQHLRAEVRIDRNLSWLFWAKYRFESWCRAVDTLTLRSVKITREKNYRGEWTAVFDQENRRVRYWEDKTELPLPDSARDMLTLWHYLRRIDWKSNETLFANAHIDRRNWRIRFVVSGRDRVKTPAGDFWCLIISPDVRGPLGAVYVADDASRFPVVIRTRVAGLTVSAYLRNIKMRL